MSADERAIREVQQEWMRATAAGDLTRVLELMADDIVFLTPGREPFGRREYAAAAEAGKGKATFRGTAEFDEVIVVGDVAYARGKLAITVEPTGGEPKQMAGYTLSIFRKLADGRWVLARDANLVGPVTAAK
jgi:uncharacterized protein (TIGR02246 family)